MRLWIFLVGFGCCGVAHATCSNTATIFRKDGSQTSFQVEISDGIFSRAKGLMFHDNLPPNAGMVFLYEQEQQIPFWMKNVSIPLDMIFVRSSGDIVSIHENAKPFDLTPINSPSPFSSVLEINGGASRRAQINLGDKLKLNIDCK